MPDSGGRSPAADHGDSQPKKILFGKYELVQLLGSGGSGKVYLARDIRTGQGVAVKCIAKQIAASRGGDHRDAGILPEAIAMRRLRHPHVLRLREVLASRSMIYFVLELARGGELFARVDARGRLPEDLSRRYFRQLVSAIGYCHSQGVFHRDIKPENLLLDDAGDLKVSDFGLCATAPEQIRRDGLLHTLCGTPAYVAPEMLAKRGYGGSPVDVWSSGIVLFVLTAGYLPFNDTNLMALYKKICRGEFRYPEWTSPELRRLLSRLLDKNPGTRITVEEILHDPWFREGLAGDEWAALARFHRDAEEQEEEVLTAAADGGEEEEGGRVLNAFEIISFSAGLDLSGLFEPVAGRERFLSAETAETVVRRLEGLEEGEGLTARRAGKKGTKVAVRGRNGEVVAAVEVHRLSEKFVVVEVGKDRGYAAGRWEGFWEKKLRPVLRALAVPGGERREGRRPEPVS